MHDNFNRYAAMNMNMNILGGNQHAMASDAQLLEQLRYMSAYGSHNQTALMLLHELHLRAARAFGKTFVPTKEVHGNNFLYTSVFKDGVMTHYFVIDKETKSKIDAVFNKTKVEKTLDGDEFSADRITLLLELGHVFNVVSVDEQGKQIGTSKRRGFASLFGSKGFNEEPRHASKVLPLAVLEVLTLGVLRTEPTLFINNVMSHACQVITDRDKLQLLEGYLRSTSVLKEYITAVTETMRLNDVGVSHECITQLHLFPADGHAPAKFLGGVNGNWGAGFIKREQYPHLFPNVNTYLHPNSNPAGFGNASGFAGGFNGFGPANGGPWA